MTARNELPSDSTRKPGPGAYRPEQVSDSILGSFFKECIKVYVTKKILPKYSFGIKHSEYSGALIAAEPKE